MFTSLPLLTECQCQEPGSQSSVCGDSGQCFCKGNFAGLNCGRCAAGYFRYPDCVRKWSASLIFSLICWLPDCIRRWSFLLPDYVCRQTPHLFFPFYLLVTLTVSVGSLPSLLSLLFVGYPDCVCRQSSYLFFPFYLLVTLTVSVGSLPISSSPFICWLPWLCL